MRRFLALVLRAIFGLFVMAAGLAAFVWLPVPRLAEGGLLGAANGAIVAYLLLLVIRHFFMIFFALRETIRRESLPRTEFAPPISIIVPAYNEEGVIADSIKALSAITYPDFEVVVVDDGSKDQTFARAQAAAAGLPNVRVFSQPNGGKGLALNFGIDHARHEYVFCMDADSYVAPQALRTGIRHFASGEVAAVAGSVLVSNVGASQVTRFQALEYLVGLNFYKAAQSFLGLVTIIPGPSGLFAKRAVRAAGGYTVDTFAEDCDLTLRLVMAGERVVYEPAMEVRTEAPETLLPLIKQRYRWNRGILQATKKHVGVLLTPHKNPVGATLIVYMLVEAVLLPVMNLLVSFAALLYIGLAADFSALSLWLAQLTLLDLSVMTFVLADLRWPTSLVLQAVVSRFTYAFFLEIVKALSSVEELLGIRMSWGKLDRLGLRT